MICGDASPRLARRFSNGMPHCFGLLISTCQRPTQLARIHSLTLACPSVPGTLSPKAPGFARRRKRVVRQRKQGSRLRLSQKREDIPAHGHEQETNDSQIKGDGFFIHGLQRALPSFASVSASDKSASARSAYALPRSRFPLFDGSSSGGRIPKLAFIGWKSLRSACVT